MSRFVRRRGGSRTTFPDGRSGTKSFLPSHDVGPATLDMDLVLLSVMLALLAAIPVLVDKVQLVNVACLAVFPFIIRLAGRDRLVTLLVGTLALWAFGQVLSDAVNGLGGLRMSLSLALAVTVLTLVPTLTHFARGDPRRIRILIVGLVGGLILWYLVFKHAPLTDPASWKFSYNPAASVALLALTDLAWLRGRRWPSLLALAAVCAVGVWSDHRGLAGIAALTGLFLLIPRRRRHRYPKISSTLTAALLLLGALSILFVDSAEAGLLGERSVSQARQYGSSPVSLLVNVRPELFQELGLFWQQPFTGFGSVPRLTSTTYETSLAFMQKVGVTQPDLHDYWLHVEDPGVSGHSQLADSLTRAGVFALPFWTLVIVLALWAGTTALRYRSSPLLVMWTMLVLWDTFFSPLPGPVAIELGGYLALALVTIAGTRRGSPARSAWATAPSRATRDVEAGGCRDV
jgi:hypothetical protein